MRVLKLTGRADRVVARIQCSAGVRMTTPALAAAVLAQRPNLARHACVNDAGATFGAVIGRTPLPHLFEHLVIDILTERTADEGAVFVGTSEWEDRASGTARVEVSYADDLEALAAIKDAAALLNRHLLKASVERLTASQRVPPCSQVGL